MNGIVEVTTFRYVRVFSGTAFRHRIFAEAGRQPAGDASVVFIGFNVPKENLARQLKKYLDTIMAERPTILLVSSSGEAYLLV